MALEHYITEHIGNRCVDLAMIRSHIPEGRACRGSYKGIVSVVALYARFGRICKVAVIGYGIPAVACLVSLDNCELDGFALFKLFVSLSAGKVELVVKDAVCAHTRALLGGIHLGQDIVLIELVDFGVAARSADVSCKIKVVTVFLFL